MNLSLILRIHLNFVLFLHLVNRYKLLFHQLQLLLLIPSLALLQLTCDEPLALAVSNGGFAITIAAPAEAEQPLASYTMIVYEPALKPENTFELCAVPPLSE